MFNQEIKKEAEVYVFIDASNVWSAIKSMRKLIEYKNLKIILRGILMLIKLKFFIMTPFQKRGREITI